MVQQTPIMRTVLSTKLMIALKKMLSDYFLKKFFSVVQQQHRLKTKMRIIRMGINSRTAKIVPKFKIESAFS